MCRGFSFFRLTIVTLNLSCGGLLSFSHQALPTSCFVRDRKSTCRPPTRPLRHSRPLPSCAAAALTCCRMLSTLSARSLTTPHPNTGASSEPVNITIYDCYVALLHDIEMVIRCCLVHRKSGATLGAVLVQPLNNIQVARFSRSAHYK